MRSLQMARAEMEQITSELRIKRALLSRIPSAAIAPLAVGQKVLVYREDKKKKSPVRWTGPFKIIRIVGK